MPSGDRWPFRAAAGVVIAGLGRLRARAANGQETLEERLSGIIVSLRTDGAGDDTALAGIRWTE
ncbi:MAG TPA: hypothetical protein VLP43_01555 [Solirubrobacteraceae bacterium]|nr:hypothetical protein [Solirubrobacteraceae bacterium]